MKASKGKPSREARKGKLRASEARKVQGLRQVQGILSVGKRESYVNEILTEGEADRLRIVTDPQFWKPIDTASLDTTQASRILDLYRWEMDRLGQGLIQAVDRRIWKVRNGGHAKGSKAQGNGPKRREAVQGKPMVQKPESRPGKPTEKGKRRFKPSRKGKGSVFDKIDPLEARSACLLWLVDNLDGKQASLYSQARGRSAWLPTLSGELQRDRLSLCRQAYFVQDNGIDPLPVGKLREFLDKLPQPKGSKAWGYSTIQHTCLNCGKRYYTKPEACEACQYTDFRSDPIGPTASLLKAVAQAVGKALNNHRLRYPNEKPNKLCVVSLDALTKGEAEADNKPNRWEPIQRSLYSHIQGKALVRLALQEAQADPKADRLTSIILGKLRGHNESLILRNIRRKLADKQAEKLGTDRSRLLDLGINPPKYERRTYYRDLSQVRSIGKLCRKSLEAEAVQEAEAWLSVQEAEADPKPIKLWFATKYRAFRRLRKQGLASDLRTFLDGSQGKADPKEAKQSKAVQEALSYCRFWASHAFDRRKLADQDYSTDRLPDPEAYLDAKAVCWNESKAWLSVQEADKPKPTEKQSQADRQAEANKRQAYRYCEYWASHAFDRRQVQNQPESFLDFNHVTWDQSQAWLRIVKPIKA